MKKTKKEKLEDKKTLALLILFKLMLEIAYIYAVSPYYSYMGFTFEPNIYKFIISTVVFLFLFFLLPKKNIFSHIITEMFFVICIIPLLSFFWMADKEIEYMLLIILFFVILALTVRFIKTETPPTAIRMNKKSNHDLLVTAFFILYVVLCIYLGFIRGGIDLRALSFDSIYKLRSEYAGSSTINNYLIGWCAKSFFSVFAVYYLYRKKYGRVALCFILQLYLYLCYGYKAYLFSAVFVFLIYFLGRRARQKKHRFINYFIVFLTVLLIPNLFVRANGFIGTVSFKIMSTYSMRMLFEPARIEFGYFSFFTENAKLLFSEGLVGKILGLKYPYSQPIGFIITEYMLGPDNISNQNTGVIADSFAEIGIFGIMIIPVLICLYFKLIDRLNKKIPTYFLVAVFAYPVFMLNDNPFFTNLLTNGLVIDWLLLILISSRITYRKKCAEYYVLKRSMT